MAYPRHRLARAHTYLTRTAGDLTLNSTAWADLSTALDLGLPAQVGDVVRVTIAAYWSNQAVAGYLDAASRVGGATANHWATAGVAGQGIVGLVGDGSTFTYRNASWRRTLEASDIESGTVTVRVRYRTSTATNKILFGNANVPFQWALDNLGPMDPN